MIKDDFYRDSIILTVSNLVAGILRFMFSILLSRKLGAEGMGLYSLVMPIYDLFTCLICGGMVTAISKESSSYYGINDYGNLNKSIHTALVFDFVLAIFVTILVFFLSPYISTYIIKDQRTLYSLWVICPALIFVALSSIYKGYFYGISNVKVPAIIDIVEKTARMAIILGLINFFALTNVTTTVTATYISLSIGELISFILLYVFYEKSKNKFKVIIKKTEGRGQLLFNVLIVSFPLCLNGFLNTVISALSTLIVPGRLVQAGIEYTESLSLIGKFSGMAMSIVFFPFIIVMSMSTMLTPDISKSISKNDYNALENRIHEVIKISFLLGISTMIICLCIGSSLGKLFFNRYDLGIYIRLAALSAPFMYMSGSTFGILNGLGKQKALLINSVLTSIVELVLLYILLGIPSINILGYGIALLISSILSAIMNIVSIERCCYIDFSGSEFLIDICLSILLYFILKILSNTIPDSIFITKNIIIIVTGFSLLLFSLILTKKSEKSKAHHPR
ncbi:stage V sporulation protein B [Clostridium estertheticum]|uniref:Multidrug-efflux transporter n=1 Tax=Clostridium estertheticum TaxID=238834 RepID=A0AA47I5X0_9CLOT|nr:stage V sporulation protein B [Clostridium estertheticum]MBU3153443.1 stage V sporulation protein B [Clostridium estertheticum]MBU3198308.1 stage V sporulation protein B [Clostridium estertheticum]WAG60847.1 stage V sporulation protein B [Clostridium estertheticum]WAG64995.1 stage V sporulation protein B [Clostridium estertheticum]